MVKKKLKPKLEVYWIIPKKWFDKMIYKYGINIEGFEKVVKLSELKKEIEELKKKGFHRKDKEMISYWFTYNDISRFEKKLGIK